MLGTGAGIAGTIRGSSDPVSSRRDRGDLAGETVDLRDHCTADGKASDSRSFQALLDRGPAEIRYSADARLMLDHPIRLRSGQTHRFAAGARIDADVDGYALSGVGETGQTLGRLIRPIARYSNTISLDTVPDVRAGDFILLADVSDPAEVQLDPNRVSAVAGTTITTVYPIGRPFAASASFRVYHVYRPVVDVRLIGPVAVSNHRASGGFLRLANASGIMVSGMTISDTGYLGISFESSLDCRFEGITVRGAGASGLGFRAAKQITLDGFTSSGVRADESLTFYDNVAHVAARNIAIRQYLFRDREKGHSAGNDILIDRLCADISLDRVTCIGAATYNVMINNQSDRCSIDNFTLRDSNLGGIRISDRCHRTRVGSGTITGVADLVDQEGKKPVSAISIGTSCTGTSISKNVEFGAIATDIRVAPLRDR